MGYQKPIRKPERMEKFEPDWMILNDILKSGP